MMVLSKILNEYSECPQSETFDYAETWLVGRREANEVPFRQESMIMRAQETATCNCGPSTKRVGYA